MSRAEPDPQKSLPKSNELLRMLVRILVWDYLLNKKYLIKILTKMRSITSLEGGVLEGSLRSKSELKSGEESGTKFVRFELFVFEKSCLSFKSFIQIKNKTCKTSKTIIF